MLKLFHFRLCDMDEFRDRGVRAQVRGIALIPAEDMNEALNKLYKEVRGSGAYPIEMAEVLGVLLDPELQKAETGTVFYLRPTPYEIYGPPVTMEHAFLN